MLGDSRPQATAPAVESNVARLYSEGKEKQQMKSAARLLAALLAPTLLAWTAFAATPLLAGPEVEGAIAELKDAQGQTVGSAILTAIAPQGVKVQVLLNGFTSAAEGDHGIHIHTVGKCEAPGFTTAGGHLNPAGKKHGLNSPEGHHAGDMPNLKLNGDAGAIYATTVSGVTLDAGAAGSIFDADGSAVVIHAGPDDMVTDPAGNSGARIACGVLVAARVPVAGMPQTGSGPDGNVYVWLSLAAALVACGVFAAGRRRSA
jgi:superoxide dismutase, Cu-Zn family